MADVTLNALPHFTDVLLKVGVERDVTCFVTWIVLLEEDARYLGSPAKLPVTIPVAPTFADDVIVTGAVNTPPVVVVPDGVPVVLFPL